MDDDTTKAKQSYSTMTVGKAQERVGIKIDLLYHNAIPVKTMLDGAQYTLEGLDPDVISKTKEAVYEMLLRHVAVEGYPGDTLGYTESNVKDLVYGILCPVIYDFTRHHNRQEATRRLLYLRREKEIISLDKETGGRGEFVVLDLIGISANDNYVLVVVEAKRSNLVEAMKQCLLAMYDMWKINGRGFLYGFVTTGEDWRMLTYDGKEFAMTRKFSILFDGFQENKELWMKNYSILINCM